MERRDPTKKTTKKKRYRKEDKRESSTYLIDLFD